MLKSKFFVAALAASIVVPAIVIPMEAQASTKSFSDVSPKNANYDAINAMTAKGIIKGYEDGTFKPNETLTRKHAATLINRAVTLKPIKNVTVPKDLTKSNAYYADIMALLNAGLLEKDAKGNVNPNKELSRGEMAKILTVAFDLKGMKHPLKDVSSKYNDYVAALYENDVTTGYEDGTFKENGSLTRAHYAVFMYRAMGLGNGVQQPTNPPKSNGISMSSSEKEINNYIKSSKLFAEGITAHPIGLEQYDGYKKVIVNAEDILAGTNLKVAKLVSGAFLFKQDNWKPVDKLLTSQVTYESDPSKEFQKISFDYTLPHSQTVAKRILTTVYGKDFDTVEFGHIIEQKVTEATESNEKWFSNNDFFEEGGFTVKMGVKRDNEFNQFIIEIHKK